MATYTQADLLRGIQMVFGAQGATVSFVDHSKGLKNAWDLVKAEADKLIANGTLESFAYFSAAVKLKVVPYSFRIGQDTYKAAFSADSSVFQVRLFLSENPLNTRMPETNDFALAIKGIVIPYEMDKADLLTEVHRNYFHLSQPVDYPIHVDVIDRKQHALIERQALPTILDAQPSWPLEDLLVLSLKNIGSSSSSRYQETTIHPDYFSLPDKNWGPLKDKIAGQTDALVLKSTLIPGVKSDISLDFRNNKLPLLFAYPLNSTTVKMLRSINCHGMSPTGIQDFANHIPLYEYQDVKTLDQLGVGGGIIHLRFGAPPVASSIELSAGSKKTRTRTKAHTSSSGEATVDLRWGTIKFPAGAISQDTLVKLGDSPTVTVDQEELPHPRVESTTLEESYSNAKYCEIQASKSDKKMTIHIIPTNPEVKPFTLSVLPSFTLKSLKDMILKSTSIKPDDMVLSMKDECDQILPLTTLQSSLETLKIVNGSTINLTRVVAPSQSNAIVVVASDEIKQVVPVRNTNTNMEIPFRADRYMEGIAAPVVYVGIGKADVEVDPAMVHTTFEKVTPTMTVNEPAEYFCPESHKIVSYSVENGGKWEELDGFKPSDDGKSCAAPIRHFSGISIRNMRHTRGFAFDPSILDPRHDFDFTNVDDTGKTFVRGGLPYKRPVGFMRFAVNINGKFENNDWIKMDGSAGEWPAAFHGTSLGSSMDIHAGGFRRPSQVRHGQVGSRTGNSIYMTPDPTYAEMYAHGCEYVDAVTNQTKKVEIVLQARIRPGSWYLQQSKNSYCNAREYLFDNEADIRLYGICLRETVVR